MQSLSALSGQQLKWSQPKVSKMEYELRSGDQLAATLRFRSSFGSFATAESAAGCWTFKRVGFWQTKVTVRVCDSDTDIATFANNTWSGGGTLTLPDGRKLLVSTNMWQTQYEIKNESETALVRYKMGGVFHLSSQVEIQPAAMELPELPWLIPFGWYLALMAYKDSAAAAAAV
ncbi:MAG TPA: hypothetical protein VGD69_27265 [Herpetosiphonaceae bacterium]